MRQIGPRRLSLLMVPQSVTDEHTHSRRVRQRCILLQLQMFCRGGLDMGPRAEEPELIWVARKWNTVTQSILL